MIMQRYPSFQSTMSSSLDETDDERKIAPRPLLELPNSSNTTTTGANHNAIREQRTQQAQQGTIYNPSFSTARTSPQGRSIYPLFPDSSSSAPNTSNSTAGARTTATATAAHHPVPIRHDGMVQVVDEVSAFSDCRLLTDRDLILDCLGPLLRKRSHESDEDEHSSNKRPFQKMSPLSRMDRKSFKKISSSDDNDDNDLRVSMKASVSLATDLDGVASSSSPAGGDTVAQDDEDIFSIESKEAGGEDGSSTATPSRASASTPLELTEYQTNLWDSRFKDLNDYRDTHGNCLVPHNWTENLALAKWVKRQRYQYKLKKSGKHSTLTEKRQKALDGLGFIWDSHNAVWEERLGELLDFKKLHGHCNVPSTYSKNHSLSVWVQCQRRHYKQFFEKKQGNSKARMSEDRVRRLESIGFVWKPRIGRNEDAEKALKRIKK